MVIGKKMLLEKGTYLCIRKWQVLIIVGGREGSTCTHGRIRLVCATRGDLLEKGRLVHMEESVWYVLLRGDAKKGRLVLMDESVWYVITRGDVAKKGRLVHMEESFWYVLTRGDVVERLLGVNFRIPLLN